MNGLKCRTLGVYNARARMLESARAIETQVDWLDVLKRYSLDQSSARALTPSCSNRWCFAVHRTKKTDSE